MNDTNAKIFIPPVPMDSTMYLTKREYFAAMAMQGLLANHEIALPNSNKDEEQFRDFAKVCIKYADELLKQLSP